MNCYQDRERYLYEGEEGGYTTESPAVSLPMQLFETHWRYCVEFLSKTLYPGCIVLVQTGKKEKRPDITENCCSGRKASTQTNKTEFSACGA